MSTGRLGTVVRGTMVALAALVLQPIVLDAVLVAPHALFISHTRKTGEVYLVNQGAVPEEVSVELKFGYPATDSAGDMMIAWPDPGPDDPSAAEWLRAFPRRVRVEPGQRQLVRVLARPPAELPDGEYWSRMIVTSRAVQPAVALNEDSTVQAGLTLELRTITSVTYRKGALQTGIRLDDFRAIPHPDSLEVWVALAREGNAAFLGRVAFELRDINDRPVGSWDTPVAVYYGLNRRFVLPTDTLPAGTYRLHLTVDTERQDIGVEDILPADPIQRSVGVELP